jgi:DNA polymerase III epsilon subunit-like protein
MAKLYFRENVDFLPECSEMYAKPESWIPAESFHSEKLRRKQLRVVPSFSQNFKSLAKPFSLAIVVTDWDMRCRS